MEASLSTQRQRGVVRACGGCLSLDPAVPAAATRIATTFQHDAAAGLGLGAGAVVRFVDAVFCVLFRHDVVMQTSPQVDLGGE